MNKLFTALVTTGILASMGRRPVETTNEPCDHDDSVQCTRCKDRTDVPPEPFRLTSVRRDDDITNILFRTAHSFRIPDKIRNKFNKKRVK